MSVEATILRIAETQLDLVAFEQLRSSGSSKDQVSRRCSSGFLVRVHPRVYRTAGDPGGLPQAALAACLAAGPEAFASHMTSAVLLDLLPGAGTPVELTVPTAKRVRLPGILVHRSAASGLREHTRIGPVPVSRGARTLVDIAGDVDRDLLERAVDEAIRRRLLTPDTLLGETRRPVFASRPGIAVLQQLARERVGEGPSESELETLAWRLLRRYRLPMPARQYETVVRGRRVRFDLAYPDQRVAIELDGWAPHYGRERWQNDHHRDNASGLAGWCVLRFTWWDVTERPLDVVLTIATRLGIRPTRWSAPR